VLRLVLSLSNFETSIKIFYKTSTKKLELGLINKAQVMADIIKMSLRKMFNIYFLLIKFL